MIMTPKKLVLQHLYSGPSLFVFVSMSMVVLPVLKELTQSRICRQSPIQRNERRFPPSVSTNCRSKRRLEKISKILSAESRTAPLVFAASRKKLNNCGIWKNDF